MQPYPISPNISKHGWFERLRPPEFPFLAIYFHDRCRSWRDQLVSGSFQAGWHGWHRYMACLAISNPRNGCFRFQAKKRGDTGPAWWVHEKQVFILHLDILYFFETQNSSKTSQKHTGPLVSAGYLGSIFSDHLSPTHSELDEAFSPGSGEFILSGSPTAQDKSAQESMKAQTHHYSLSEISWCREWCSTVVKLNYLGLYPSCASFWQQ